MTDNQTETRVKKNSKALLIAAIILGVVALVGIGMWINQSIAGLQVTGMRNLSSWGLYITMFMFFVGLSAGGLIISSAPKVFGLTGFKNISKIAVTSSIVCTILAISYVLVDLGHPERFWHLLVYGQFNSPLMWDMFVLTVYLVLSIVYLRMLVLSEKGKTSGRALKVVSTTAFLIAILVHSVTAWIFSLNTARPFWNTALMAPWFVSSALVSGLGLVLILIIVLNKTGYIKVESADLQKMGKLLGIFVAVDLFLFFCDILTGIFTGAGQEYDIVQQLLVGSLAPFFWVEIIGGVIAMFLMYTPNLRKLQPAALAAAILGVIGVFCKRAQLIEGGFQIPNITWAGSPVGLPVPGGTVGLPVATDALVYWPSLYEAGLTICVLALGVCLFLLALYFLPLGNNRDSEQ